MRLTRQTVRWLETAVWMVLIFSSSGEAGAASRTFALLQYGNELLHLSLRPETLLLLNLAIRKAAHFSAYLILGLLFYRALAVDLTRFSFRFAGWTAAAGLLYALTDEFHQVFVSSRTASLYDVSLDFTGVVASQAFLLLRSRFSTSSAQRTESLPPTDAAGEQAP